MKEKLTIPIVIVLVVLFVLFVAYMADGHDEGEMKSFNVSSGAFNLADAVADMKKPDYYKGCDSETVKWMESLQNKKVFFGNDIVIMNAFDAMKIPPDPGVTDACVYDYFTAEIIESHDLGSEYPTVYYVKNVNYTDRDIIANGLA